MVDQGPVGDFKARKLFRYWTRGPGAAKIMWGVPHDFDRCVTLLTKYFPKNPKGLCANLHHRALGVWPGQEDGGRSHHELLELLASGIDPEGYLVASAPSNLDTSQIMHWMAPLFDVNGSSSDMSGSRRINLDGFSHRDLPMPLRWSEKSNTGRPHGDSVVVGRITGVDVNADGAVAWGDIFPSDVVPQAHTMAHLAQGGVLGLSMDPGGPVEMEVDDTDETEPEFDDAGSPITKVANMVFTKYHMGGATAVPVPAYAGQRMLIWNSDEDDLDSEFNGLDLGDEETYGIVASVEFTVVAHGWESMPVAPRAAKWSADSALQRIFAWANGDPKKLSTIFMWKDPHGDPRDLSSYRLPIADIVDDQPVMYYSAVYHGAALLQGGHGGLPMLSDAERTALKAVFTRIYVKVSNALGVHIDAPWNRAPTRTTAPRMEVEMPEDETLTAAVNGGGWASMPMASPDTAWDGGAAKKALGERAGINGDNPSWQKYGQGFLWHANSPKSTADFKLPIATVIDGKLTIIPRAVNAVASVLAGGRGGVDIPDADKARISSVVAGLQKRFKEGDSSMTAAGAPLAPPATWFEDPKLQGKTKVTVDESGRVFGHLADWTTCHLGIQGKCIMAPHSHNDYADFHVGTIVTQEGDVLDVGNLTANTGHAPLSLSAGATKSHYDDTGSQVAVVRAGEDQFGIWVAGALVPEVDIPATGALMRRSPLSGDWRTVDGHLSLVAALHVNRPGFQIKPMFTLDGEEVVALQAAGVLHENTAETVYLEGMGGGTIVHTPQSSTPVAESDDDVDPQIKRAARLDLLLNMPVRSDRIKKALEG